MDSDIIKVNMLGGFSISGFGARDAVSDMTSRSRKVLTLLQYLIVFRKRDIPQAEVIDMLWPDGAADESANTLKTLLHRSRAALDALGEGMGKRLIICRRGTYSWNTDIPLELDSDTFERQLRKASGADSDDARLESLLAALALYKGDFLPKASSELWVIPMSAYFHNAYMNSVHEALELLTAQARFGEVISLCQKAVVIDPFDETVHLSMIQALMASGMQRKAMDHYNKVTQVFLDQYGITPSPELTALYKQIIKTTKDTEMNLGIIREELRESAENTSAFFCEYEFFKDIYRLQARSAVRSGGVVQIALITVMDSAGKKLGQKQLALAMQRLGEIIGRLLRASDVYCRFSVNQYLIMLPSASLEDSDMVLRRLNGSFRREYPHMNILLHYTALPMEPRV